MSRSASRPPVCHRGTGSPERRISTNRRGSARSEARPRWVAEANSAATGGHHGATQRREQPDRGHHPQHRCGALGRGSVLSPRIRPGISGRHLCRHDRRHAGGFRLPAVAGAQPRQYSPDGTSTRVKIDLFPEYIRHLTPAKRPLWDLVGRALTSEDVQAAFMRRLAPGLKRRFGEDFASVGMYPIPVLTRDIPGYRITPHTDTQWKGMTIQLYLPRDASATHIGTIFHERLPDGSLPKICQMKFAPNTGYAFAVGDNTWHSADPVGTEVDTRDSILLTYFVDAGMLRILAQSRQARRQFSLERGQALGAPLDRRRQEMAFWNPWISPYRRAPHGRCRRARIRRLQPCPSWREPAMRRHCRGE